MTNKQQFILSLVAIVVVGALIAIGFHTSDTKPANTEVTPQDTEALAWPSQEVDKIVVKESTTNYTIDASYPKVASDSMTLQFKNYVEGQIAGFKEDTAWVGEVESASSTSLTLDISYEFVGGKNAQNYIFTINSYTGGAHGMQTRKTFSFNREGQLLTLSNLFSNGTDGLPTFAALVQKELEKRPGADKDWIADGAAAKEDNYASFLVTDAGITVLFDPYQVASYADGPIDVAIPLSSFKKIANKDLFPN